MLLSCVDQYVRGAFPESKNSTDYAVQESEAYNPTLHERVKDVELET